MASENRFRDVVNAFSVFIDKQCPNCRELYVGIKISEDGYKHYGSKIINEYIDDLCKHRDKVFENIRYVAILFPEKVGKLIVIPATKDIYENLERKFRNCEDIEVKFYDGSS